MPAIITDQFRIANAETFVQSFSGTGTESYYYSFLAHPEGDEEEFNGFTVKNYKSISNNGTEPDVPRDSFEQESSYHDSMLFAKRITSSDVARVIPNRPWSSGETFDMYRHDVDVNNPTNVTSSTNLYDSKFYTINDEYRVYVCINNGTMPDSNGKLIAGKSLNQPTHIDLSPRAAGDGSDGYLWKYLYSIKPAEVIKFGTDDFIPVPSDWGDSNTIEVKNAAVNGKIETIMILDEGSGIAYNNSNSTIIPDVPLYGDGVNAKASVTITSGKVKKIQMSDGGMNYTCAVLNLEAKTGVTVSTDKPVFKVIIPPQGGHGADIYKELGAFRVLMHSKFDDKKEDLPDYVIDNNFSRVGIIKNPIKQDESGTSTELINTTTATTLGAIKLKGDSSNTKYPVNSIITQTQSTGKKAVGVVASYDQNTNVLRYYQPVGLSTFTQFGNELIDFISESVTIEGLDSNATGELPVDVNQEGSSVDGEFVGVSFVNGIAKPEIKRYTGDIIYIDNRNKVTRSSSQKEEIKVVIEF